MRYDCEVCGWIRVVLLDGIDVAEQALDGVVLRVDLDVPQELTPCSVRTAVALDRPVWMCECGETFPTRQDSETHLEAVEHPAVSLLGDPAWVAPRWWQDAYELANGPISTMRIRCATCYEPVVAEPWLSRERKAVAGTQRRVLTPELGTAGV